MAARVRCLEDTVKSAIRCGMLVSIKPFVKSEKPRNGRVIELYDVKGYGAVARVSLPDGSELRVFVERLSLLRPR